MEKNMFCIYCGAKNFDDAKFCSACGKTIAAQEDGSVQQEVIPPVQQEPVNQQPATPAAEQPAQNENYSAVNDAPATPPQQPVAAIHQQPVPGVNIYNYFIPSLLLTIFSFLCCCCNPMLLFSLAFGITAMVFSSQVKQKIACGDIVGAREAAEKAKTWCLVSGVFFALGWIMGMILTAVKPEIYRNLNHTLRIPHRSRFL